MLLPGSSVRPSLVDRLFVWAPLALGAGAAAYKAARGTLDFGSLRSALTSALLVALPMTWCVWFVVL